MEVYMYKYNNIFIIRVSKKNNACAVCIVHDGKEEIVTKKFSAMPDGEYNNAIISGNELVSCNGRLNAISGKKTDVVIIKEFKSAANNEVIGYRVVRCNTFEIVNIRRDKMIDMLKSGRIVVQNAMYVSKSSDREEHIRFFAENQVPVEVVGIKSSDASTEKKAEAAEEKKNNETSCTDMSMYSEAQLAVINLAKTNYNIELTKYVNHEYGSGEMAYIMAGIVDGYDVSAILNPKYNQFQMSEIIGGQIDGIDIGRYSDPAIPVEEMQEIHAMLFRKMWYGGDL